MSKEQQQKQFDAVTVGHIRRRQEKMLDRQLSELSAIVRGGLFKLPEAEKFLKEQIGKTLEVIQNINALASTEVLFPEEQPKQ